MRELGKGMLFISHDRNINGIDDYDYIPDFHSSMNTMDNNSKWHGLKLTEMCMMSGLRIVNDDLVMICVVILIMLKAWVQVSSIIW